jgi:Protein of unknown function (DUF2950)
MTMSFIRLRAAGLALVSLAASLTLLACSPKGTFETPEEAVQAAADVAGKGDTERVVEIFGPDGPEMFSSGDPQDDAEDVERVKKMVLEKVAFEDVDEKTKIALFGNDAWPFPIPLVLEESRWRFDSAAGREELLNRRIGRNELLVLASLHAYVDAQKEYFSQSRDGKPPAYARKFWSSDGAHDGLYWPEAEGEPESPLGPLLAEASARRDPDATPQPYNGYHFRILEAQGKSAPGGERSYLDEQGAMTKGFGAVAWPAKYGNSGVMTFQVNQQGVIFQKDLGAETDTAVAAITAYDPDESWAPDPD